MKNSQIKCKKHLQPLNESVEFLFTKFDTLEKERGKHNEQIWKLEVGKEKLQKRNKSLDESADDLEQHSPQKCLLHVGKEKETKNENTNDVTVKKLSRP